jgi:hypothetical protein
MAVGENFARPDNLVLNLRELVLSPQHARKWALQIYINCSPAIQKLDEARAAFVAAKAEVTRLMRALKKMVQV